MQTELIKISEIKIDKYNRRPIDQEYVQYLVRSIDTVGLLNPITVSGELDLLNGRHRLQAQIERGENEILCNIVAYLGEHSELLKNLAMIDENLIRKELHYIERGEQMAEKKEIYEKLYPGVKHGGDRKSEKIKSQSLALDDMVSFVDDTASKTGKSKSTVKEEIFIAKSLIPEIKTVIIEQDVPKLQALQLAKQTEEIQKAVLKKILEEEKTFSTALKEFAGNGKRKQVRHPVVSDAEQITSPTPAERENRESLAEEIAGKVDEQIVEKQTAQHVVVPVFTVNEEQKFTTPSTPEVDVTDEGTTLQDINEEKSLSVLTTSTANLPTNLKKADIVLLQIEEPVSPETVKNLKRLSSVSGVLFITTTVPLLHIALNVIEDAGFSYKSFGVFSCEKVYKEGCFYINKKCLLYAKKGVCSLPDDDNTVPFILAGRNESNIIGIVTKVYPTATAIESFPDGIKGWEIAESPAEIEEQEEEAETAEVDEELEHEEIVDDEIIETVEQTVIV